MNGVGFQRHAPAALTVRKRACTHQRGRCVGPSAGLFLEKNEDRKKGIPEKKKKRQ